jgi:hypothetical protein
MKAIYSAATRLLQVTKPEKKAKEKAQANIISWMIEAQFPVMKLFEFV